VPALRGAAWRSAGARVSLFFKTDALPFRDWTGIRRIEMRAVLAIVLVALGTAPAGQVSPLEATAFMAGCWRGAAGTDRIIEEFYMRPGPNLMQGMTRFVGPRGDVTGLTLDFEFTLIDVDHDRTRLRPHPRGAPSAVFAETERTAGRMVWENPDHDFPQKISYTRAPGDSLIARIEGRTPSGERAIEWRMGRVGCPGT
jgi:hypothetical protein